MCMEQLIKKKKKEIKKTENLKKDNATHLDVHTLMKYRG